MRTLKLLLAITALSVATCGAASAAETPAHHPDKKTPAQAGSKRKLPFQGEVKAVDGVAKTFTIGERVFHITSETRFHKEGKPGTFDDVKAGEHLRGSYLKTPEGKLEAASVFVGKKEDEHRSKKPADKKGELNKAEPKPAK